MTYKHPLLFKALCYVDGHWVHSDSASTVAVHNPANQKLIGHVPLLEKPQIVAAIGAAHRAFNHWREQSLAARAHVLRRWAALLPAHQADLALMPGL